MASAAWHWVVALHLFGASGAASPLGIEPFANFVRVHGRSYAGAEYEWRRKLYEKRADEVERHNQQPGQLWVASINKLADRTEEELAQLRGYHRQAHAPDARPHPVQFLSKSTRSSSLVHLPEDFDWKHLEAMKDIQDQSSCGSCWAFASATTLRAHSELYQKDRKFSVQEIIACTPNPMKCGGDGGCKGATAELAMEYVMENGCRTDSEWPYHGRDQVCPKRTIGSSLFVSSKKALQHGADGTHFGMYGYRKLPENQIEPVMLALYELGPVAVSVAAGYQWNFYRSGIMNACLPDAVINHAVTLVGFGMDRSVAQEYWLIQNSWSAQWGEGGFIRLLRRGTEEADFCGWDDKPEMGSGCAGGPSRVRICGTCGILYDVVVPSLKLSPSGWWARSGTRFPEVS